MKKTILKVTLMTAFLSLLLASCGGIGGQKRPTTTSGGNDTNPDNAIAGPIKTAETWEGKDDSGESITYYINSTLYIKDGGALKIEDGAIVKFGPNGGITVNNTGSLEANGAVFTSYRDDRGRTISIAGTTEPAKGDWNQIKIYGGTSKFTNCEFSYGGNGKHTLEVLKNTSKGKARVDNCLFKFNSGTTAVNNTVKAALYYDDQVDYDAQTNCVTNTRFEGNVWPLSLPAFFSVKSSNTFVNNTYNYVLINYNHVSADTVWEYVGVPYLYVYSYVLYIDNSAKLTIVGSKDKDTPNMICIATKSLEIKEGGTLNLSDYITFSNSPESPGTTFEGLYCAKDYKFDTNDVSGYDTIVSKVLLIENPEKPNYKIENCSPTGSNYLSTSAKYQYFIEEIKDKNEWSKNY